MNNQGRNAVLIVCVAIVIITIAMIMLGTGDGGQVPSGYGLTHTVSADAEQGLLDYLSQSSDYRVAVALPDTDEWQKGETGAVLLGISNTHEEDRTFYINVYLEDVLQMSYTASQAADIANPWLTFSGSLDVPAGDKETSLITIKPGNDASTGIYLFRVVVCMQPETDCHTISPAVGYDTPSYSRYGSAQFAIKILES